VSNGLFRSFITNEFGKDSTIKFYQKGDFIIYNPENNLINGEEIFIEIIETTELLCLRNELFNKELLKFSKLLNLLSTSIFKYIGFLNNKAVVFQSNCLEE